MGIRARRAASTYTSLVEITTKKRQDLETRTDGLPSPLLSKGGGVGFKSVPARRMKRGDRKETPRLP